MTRASGGSSSEPPRAASARQQIWDELHAFLALDGDPDDDLDPETTDLFCALREGGRAATAVTVLQGDDEVIIPTRRAG